MTDRGSGGQEYLVSVSDLMAGLIFVFIITLIVFVLRLQSVTSNLQSASSTRTILIKTIAERLEDADSTMTVEIDTLQGILRLTTMSINFERGSFVPLDQHLPRVDTVASVLAVVLPCFLSTDAAACTDIDFDRAQHGALLSLVLIEGHTDNAPVIASRRFRDNVDLSGLRASSIHSRMRHVRPTLDSLRNSEGHRVLSISGYGAQRPLVGVAPHSSAQRRIDLRFLMEPPRSTSAVAGAVGDRIGQGGL